MEDQEKEAIGKVAGMGGGMLAGARVGAFVLPIPVVGPFAGAVLGGLVGSEIGKTAGKAVINGATAFVDTFKQPTPATDTDDDIVDAEVVDAPDPA